MTKEEQAQGWLRSASNLRRQADTLKSYAPAESVALSQRSIELSVKSMFTILDVTYYEGRKEHKFSEKLFGNLMSQFPPDLEYDRSRLPRLLLLEQFWAEFRSVAHYGFETLRVPQGKLFETAEAELASKHAEECYNAANRLINKILYS